MITSTQDLPVQRWLRPTQSPAHMAAYLARLDIFAALPIEQVAVSALAASAFGSLWRVRRPTKQLIESGDLERLRQVAINRIDLA